MTLEDEAKAEEVAVPKLKKQLAEVESQRKELEQRLNDSEQASTKLQNELTTARSNLGKAVQKEEILRKAQATNKEQITKLAAKRKEKGCEFLGLNLDT